MLLGLISESVVLFFTPLQLLKGVLPLSSSCVFMELVDVQRNLFGFGEQSASEHLIEVR